MEENALKPSPISPNLLLKTITLSFQHSLHPLLFLSFIIIEMQQERWIYLLSRNKIYFNLESPINLTCMSFDREYLGKTHMGEHTNSTKSAGGFGPRTLWDDSASHCTTMPPSVAVSLADLVKKTIVILQTKNIPLQLWWFSQKLPKQ